MQTVYEAADMLEAHMVAGMLDQQGIEAWVLGDVLQGAIGEVPPGSLARVVTRAEHVTRARAIIEDWERRHPATGSMGSTESHAQARAARGYWPVFMLGVLTGMLVMALLMR